MISVRVPGKIMLAGEYTVLTGRPALAATLDKHLTVRARNRSPYETPDGGILVTSDLWNLPPEDKRSDDTSMSSEPVGFLIHRRGAFAKPLYLKGAGRGREWGPAFPLPETTRGTAQLATKDHFATDFFTTDLSSCPPGHRPLLLAAWEGVQTFNLDRGALHVISELDVRFGLGSSSALYLGVLGACAALGQKPAFLDEATPWGVPRLAMKLQSAAQRRASGYDIATQFLGGLVEFRGHEQSRPLGQKDALEMASSISSEGSDNLSWADWPRSAVRLGEVDPHVLARYVHIFVGGGGAPTGPLVRSTLEWLHQRGLFQELCSRDAKVQTCLKALWASSTSDAHRHQQGQLSDLIKAIQEHRQLIAQMPQFPTKLAQTLLETTGCDQTWTFKTTGAGGEDALLVWGDLPHLTEPTRVLRTLGWRRLDAGFERFGMQVQPTSSKNTPPNTPPRNSLGETSP